MSNFFKYKDKDFPVGSTISVHYSFKEGEKTRKQIFKGTLLSVKGSTDATRTITVRKISHAGIGVERIIPLASPFVDDITLTKKVETRRAKMYFVRNLSVNQLK